ncbi:MAG: polysaccharide deacetylase family protein [Candidatus Riflebacteria bacterium]|nr:polysaccharide deacetylase family protein [Candidatus Riflebacteria bacterium]
MLYYFETMELTNVYFRKPSIFIGILAGLCLGIWSYFDFSENILLVLAFHGVSEDTRVPWEISFPKLKGYIEKLFFFGYREISPEGLENWLEGNHHHGKFFYVTFDDGLLTSMEAMKKLKTQFQIKPAIFIVTDFLGRPGYLSEEDTAELASSGFLIGLHGKTHETTLKKNQEQLCSDLKNAIARLEKIESSKIRWYAYPFGEFDQNSIKAVEESGLKYAFTIEGHEVKQEDSRLLVPRLMYLSGAELYQEPVLEDWLPPRSFRKGCLKVILSVLFFLFAIIQSFMRGSPNKKHGLYISSQ